jgi:hypothetical protein
MKRFLLLFTIFLLNACTTSVSKEELIKLNGYWEIIEVEFSNGQKKSYKVNPSIDYIELKEMKGYKKKVQPKFDGTYNISNDSEPFTIIEKDGVFMFTYKNILSEWEEKLISIDDNTFIISNEDNITYTYKRYEPIKIQ